MKYLKYVSLIGALLATVSFIGSLIIHNFINASTWLMVACWAWSTYFSDKLSEKRKQKLDAIEDVIMTSNNELETVQKIKEII